MSKTIDRSQIQINSNSVHFENLNIEDIGWKELSERVRSWDKIVYHRVLKRSNPAEKKILGLLRGINPNVPSTWVDFKGRDFRRWIQASFEYEKKK